ncbi:DUF3710 domain-containing protein [Granulicoccus phenolivorans]|uniref:DUF3710 domain-containing protein n=1 Tax=Granulicoccus phenolivorans TaxID=266854 RepID=UPI00042449E9|nr:DUF3710 domain-containing protein [Granulicoccus phenolivorans]
MIFGRKKKAAKSAEETSDERDLTEDETTREEDSDDVDDEPTDLADDADDEDDTLEDDDDDDTLDDDDDEDDEDEDEDEDSEEDDEFAGLTAEQRKWAEFDRSADWRAEGPFDIDEVDLEDDDIQRIDFGSMIITPMPECEIRLQMHEASQQIVSALLIAKDSALELAAFAAPSTPGMWAEVRQEIIEATQESGGFTDLVEGPFGTELIRNQPVQTPEGQTAIQASRTWVAEGPRWLLRGVLFGEAALAQGYDDDVVGPLYDVFCDTIVRRGDSPKPMGDVLALTIPDELQQNAAEADA